MKIRKILGIALIGVLLLSGYIIALEYQQESKPIFRDRQTFTTQINTERALRDLPAVKNDTSLEELAEAKCTDMVERHYTAHVDPDGHYLWDSAPKGYKYGENLAGGFYSSEATVKNWIASPSHLANIVDPAFKLVGHATCFDGKQYLNVEVFRS